VITTNDDGYFEFYNSQIHDNNAYYTSVSEMFSSASFSSLIDNCIVYNNEVLSKEEIESQILTKSNFRVSYLFIDYMYDSFKTYLNENPYLLTQKQRKSTFQAISANFIMQNNTVIKNQDYLVSAIDSVVAIDDIIVENITATEPAFTVTRSTFSITNSAVTNFSHSNADIELVILSSSDFEIRNITYKDSNASFMLSTFSAGTIDQVTIQDIHSFEPTILIYSTNLSMTDSSLTTVSTDSRSIINAQLSSISLLSSVSITDTNQIALKIEDTDVTLIESLNILRSSIGINLMSSSIGELKNSEFKDCGEVTNILGGGFYSEYSNFTIHDTKFYNNTAEDGAAVTVICSINRQCNTSISNSTFENNTAIFKGGAIFYNMNRPQLTNNIYGNNTATYGNNIASYAVRIIDKNTGSNKINLYDYASGQLYNETLKYALVDYDDQEMVLDDESTIKISSVTDGSSVSRTSSEKVTAGLAKFDAVILGSKAGSINTIFSLTSRDIVDAKVKVVTTDQEYIETYTSHLNISFRYCQPGEYENSNGFCTVCSQGTYTFEWNSTTCINCMSHATCEGGTEIRVASDYWRKNTNSTETVE
jgi:hypothetical protein